MNTTRIIGLLQVVAIAAMLAACSSAGERAAKTCTDAKLAPGTPGYESCVLSRLPAGD